ncbi:hypothetical protein ACKKBG_A26345 [Auxenochlorella protothecoides x Auxenochlorella symbiontica]
MPGTPCAVAGAQRTTSALAGPQSVVASFQEKLAEGQTTSSWLDEQIETASSCGPSTSARAQPARSGPHRAAARIGAQPAVESATTQIVNRALRLLKANTARSGGEGEESATPDALVLKKGLDAFSGVGKMMEGLAHTLDDVIGQAFKDWSTPLTDGPGEDGARAGAHSAPPQDGSEPWTDFAVAEEWGTEAGWARRGRARGGKPAPGAKSKTMSPFLNRLNAVSDLLEQGDAAEAAADAQPRAAKPPRSAREPVKTVGVREPDDFVSEQVTEQMQALLEEKARLARENARLLLENAGLKELLAFTLAHQTEVMGDDELFNDHGDYYEPDRREECVGPNALQLSPPIQSEGVGLHPSADAGAATV